MKKKREKHTIHPLTFIFFWIIFLASNVSAEIKLDAVYPTLGEMGQNLIVTLKGTGFYAYSTRVSMYLDSGNRQAIVGTADTPIVARGVAVSGNYAYVADGSSGIQVIDISSSSNPQLIGLGANTPGSAIDLVISDSYVYVADGSKGLQIIDVSTPSSPEIIGSVDTPGSARDVAVSGSYAYVADSSSGLHIIDISTPSEPINVGDPIPMPGSYEADCVAVSGSYAYVAGGYWGGLQVVDISNPSAPQIIGTGVVTPGIPNDVTISGNYAYVADSAEGLQVIDISTPSSPQIVGSVETADDAQRIVISGNYAYVADRWGGLQVIDVSIPSHPLIIGSIDTPDSAYGVAVSGSYAYVGDGYLGLHVIDISMLSRAQFAFSMDSMDMGEEAFEQAQNITLSGNYAYIGCGGLKVVDISTPSAPHFEGSLEVSFGDIAVSGNYAYVTVGYDGLKVIDISTPSAPQTVGTGVDTPGYAGNLAISGHYAYVGDNDGGLQVIDISTPSNPQLVGSEENLYGGDVAVSGNYAYVIGSGKLEVIDISASTNPHIVGSVEQTGYASVAVSGNYAYVATNHSSERKGLEVIDISTPSSPQVVRLLDLPGWPNFVTISGSYAYVLDTDVGIQVIDISSPTNPIVIGVLSTLSLPYWVAVSGNFAYVADGKAGLTILPVPVEIEPVNVNSQTEISLSLPSPLVKGRYTLRVFWTLENDELSGAVSFTNDESILNSKAIVVAGGGPEAEGGTLWEETKQCANKAYDALILQGYQHDSIFYMSMESGNSYVDPFNPNDMKSDLANAITTWANNATQLLLFFADHGQAEQFVLYKDGQSTQILNAQELDGWLDSLQNNGINHPPVTFIYDACESGSFVSKMRPPAGKDRVVITSSSYEPAYFLENGKTSFSFQFWDSTLLNQGNLGDSFSDARGIMQSYQSAQLEANWDYEGNANESMDISIADGMTIQRGGYAYIGVHPFVTNVSDPQTISSETEATIWASGVIDAESVWALIIPPDVNPDNPGTPIETLPSIQLTDPDGDRIYQETYTSFNKEGTYVIVIKAQAPYELYSYVQGAMINQTIYSPPMYTSVTKTSGDPGIEPDSYEDDDIFSQASPIVANDYAPQSHNFHDVGDVDWVKFYGLLSEIYKVKAYSLGVTCDVVVELYGSDGTTLLAGPKNDAGTGEDEFLEWTCPQEGVYYVKITSVNTNYGENVRYDLKVYRPIGGEPGKLIGQVTDSQDNAIGDAFINTNLGSTWTYPNGYYWLYLPSGTHSVSVTATGYDPGSATVNIQAGNDTIEHFVMQAANQAPTDINLSSTSVAENLAVETTVGTFSTTDPDTEDSHSYSLVSGDGDSDNGSFTINGSELRTAAEFDYEAKSSYSIRVQTDDNNGGTYEKEFIITITDANDAPDAVNDSFSVLEDSSSNSLDVLSNDTDPDAGDTRTIISLGATSNGGTVSTDGSTVTYTPAAGYVGQETFDYTIQDSGTPQLTDTATVTVTVNNVNDPPTVANPIPDQDATVDIFFSFQFAAETFSDPDIGDTLSYSATLSDSTPLPDWLNFDEPTRTFSGTPSPGDVGTITIRVTATDNGTPPANIFDDFNLSIGIQINLKKGFNLVAIPEDVSGQPDLRDWLPTLGSSAEIEKVMAYDVGAGKYITLIPEDPSNPIVILSGGEGLIVYAMQDKEVPFVSLFCSDLDLNQGFNLIGIACPPENYTAFQLLTALGSSNVVSVQRYSTEKGMFETAGFDQSSTLSGVDFPITAGEGYFIYMKQEVLDVTF